FDAGPVVDLVVGLVTGATDLFLAPAGTASWSNFGASDFVSGLGVVGTGSIFSAGVRPFSTFGFGSSSPPPPSAGGLRLGLTGGVRGVSGFVVGCVVGCVVALAVTGRMTYRKSIFGTTTSPASTKASRTRKS